MSTTPSTLADWVNYLESLDPKRIELGLDRIGTVAKRLDLLNFSCPVITIAGTNGKGSTAALLTAIYRAAGYQVGCYTSPHINHYRERIQIDGQPVADAQLCDVFARIKQAAAEIYLTYFEFGTLAALAIFNMSDLDVIVLEVGLGGRLDAVNTVEPAVAVITSIGLDHCDYLGDTREEIALEKAGIFRKSKPAICGDLNPPHSLLDYVETHEISCYFRNQQFTVHPHGTDWTWKSDTVQWDHLPIPKLGIDNAATALMVVTVLQNQRCVTEHAIKSGLQTADCKGRWQRLETLIPTYLDVCHNPPAAVYLAQRFKDQLVEGKIYAICGIQAHKDISGTLKPLLPYVAQWVVTEIKTSTTATVEQLQRCLADLGVSNVMGVNTPEQAYQTVLKQAQKDDCILIFGSFYTIAPFLTPV